MTNAQPIAPGPGFVYQARAPYVNHVGPLYQAEHNAPGEMTLSPSDVQLGTVAGAAFWLSAGQRDYLASLQLTLAVAPGSNGGFSLEDGSGQRFVLSQRLFSDDELAALAQQDAALVR